MRIWLTCLLLLFCSIFLSCGIGCFYNYFYPLSYQKEIDETSLVSNIDSALIASVVNVESGYKPDVVSPKGAVGLMQLLPATAEWMAKRLGKEYSKDKLYEPSYNLEIGSCYLAYLIDCFKDEKLGLCAYNAGPKNVKEWLKNKEYSEDGKVLKIIPFKETENYINKVYKNYQYYKIKYK